MTRRCEHVSYLLRSPGEKNGNPKWHKDIRNCRVCACFTVCITSASRKIFPAESLQLPDEKMLFFFWLECHSGRCDHRNSRRFIIIWNNSWRSGKRPKGIKNGHISLTLTVQMFFKMSIDDYLFLLVFLPLEENKKVKCVNDTVAYRIMHVMKCAGATVLSWPLWYTWGISV